MKRYDVRHIAFHVLIGIYFVWFFVFAALIAMALMNVLGHGNPALSPVFMLWMFLNLVMGTALFIVIRLFRQETVLNRIVLYTYFLMAAATVTTVLIVQAA